MTMEDFLDAEEGDAQTAYQIARDTVFLSLVCEALVAVSHQFLRSTPVTEWGMAPDPVRFAARAARSPESFQHAAALGVLAQTDAPANPYDVAWLRDALTALWPTLTIVCLHGEV